MPSEATQKKWLVLRAGTRDCRVLNTRPSRLRWDELAWQIEFTIPTVWGRVQEDIIRVVVPDVDETDLRVRAMGEEV